MRVPCILPYRCTKGGDMPEPLNVGVIGLGVMGQRMLDRIKALPRLRAAMI